MVRIRMQRLGRHRRPFYRINAIDKRTRRDGAAIEQLGWFDPLAPDPAKVFAFNVERIKHWLSKGAQPSDTVRDLFMKHGIYDAEAKKAWEAERVTLKAEMEVRVAAALVAAAEKKDDKKKKK
jgi:small subunit ribosomal protein S16